MLLSFPIELVVLGFVSVIFWLFVFVTIYHLIRFGVGTHPKIVAAIYLAGSGGLFSISALLFLLVDFPLVVQTFIELATLSAQ